MSLPQSKALANCFKVISCHVFFEKNKLEIAMYKQNFKNGFFDTFIVKYSI